METDAQLDLGFSFKSQTSPTPSDSGGPSLKTSPVSSVVKEDETLLRWLERYLGQRLTFQTVAGKTPVCHLGQKGLSSGQLWMRNTSEFRNGAVASSLSEILETGNIDPRYFLSPKACAGILRRAEKRGKELPKALHQALQAVAGESPEPASHGARIP